MEKITLADSLANLNSYINVDTLLKGKPVAMIINAAAKLFNKAKDYHELGDLEMAYITYMKYFKCFRVVQNSKDYAKNKLFYDQLMGYRQIESLKRAEDLSRLLQEEYDKRNCINDTNELLDYIQPVESNEFNITECEMDILEKQRNILVIDMRARNEYQKKALEFDPQINIPFGIFDYDITSIELNEWLKDINQNTTLIWKNIKTYQNILLVDETGNQCIPLIHAFLEKINIQPEQRVYYLKNGLEKLKLCPNMGMIKNASEIKTRETQKKLDKKKVLPLTESSMQSEDSIIENDKINFKNIYPKADEYEITKKETMHSNKNKYVQTNLESTIDSPIYANKILYNTATNVRYSQQQAVNRSLAQNPLYDIATIQPQHEYYSFQPFLNVVSSTGPQNIHPYESNYRCTSNNFTIPIVRRSLEPQKAFYHHHHHHNNNIAGSFTNPPLLTTDVRKSMMQKTRSDPDLVQSGCHSIALPQFVAASDDFDYNVGRPINMHNNSNKPLQAQLAPSGQYIDNLMKRLTMTALMDDESNKSVPVPKSQEKKAFTNPIIPPTYNREQKPKAMIPILSLNNHSRPVGNAQNYVCLSESDDHSNNHTSSSLNLSQSTLNSKDLNDSELTDSMHKIEVVSPTNNPSDLIQQKLTRISKNKQSLPIMPLSICTSDDNDISIEVSNGFSDDSHTQSHNINYYTEIRDKLSYKHYNNFDPINNVDKIASISDSLLNNRCLSTNDSNTDNTLSVKDENSIDKTSAFSPGEIETSTISQKSLKKNVPKIENPFNKFTILNVEKSKDIAQNNNDYTKKNNGPYDQSKSESILNHSFSKNNQTSNEYQNQNVNTNFTNILKNNTNENLNKIDNNALNYTTMTNKINSDMERKELIVPSQYQNTFAAPPMQTSISPISNNQVYGLTGIMNTGNSCFINSILQCLAYTIPLAEFFVNRTYFNYLRNRRSERLKQSLASEFAAVLSALWSSQYPSINPISFSNAVARYAPTLEIGFQQDSHELLTYLLDGLHEDLNNAKNNEIPNVPSNMSNNASNTQMNNNSFEEANKAWSLYRNRNDSIIIDLITGQLKSVVQCQRCGKESLTFDTFQGLSLPLPSSGKCTLQDCLRQFLSPEPIEGWTCPNCKHSGRAIKRLYLWLIPSILIIHLMRFKTESLNVRRKITTYVDFPLNGFDLSGYCESNIINNAYLTRTLPEYSLYAVSNHYGTLEGGHYTACCKNPYDQNWYKFDDQQVTRIPASEVRSSAAYILFYTSMGLNRPNFKF